MEKNDVDGETKRLIEDGDENINLKKKIWVEVLKGKMYFFFKKKLSINAIFSLWSG